MNLAIEGAMIRCGMTPLPWRRGDGILDRIHVLATVAMHCLSNNELDNR